MNDREIFITMLNDNLNEINSTIDSLYSTPNYYVRVQLLNRLRKLTSNISLLTQGLLNNIDNESSIQSNVQSNEPRTYTLAELSSYNGKDGNPAYVAVNGTVYDVTDVAAWGGATHFGLMAGRDVTNEFASCHAGQQILNRLKVVGTLAG